MEMECEVNQDRYFRFSLIALARKAENCWDFPSIHHVSESKHLFYAEMTVPDEISSPDSSRLSSEPRAKGDQSDLILIFFSDARRPLGKCHACA